MDTEMGPLITPQHMDRVLGYINTAVEEGATIVTGGKAGAQRHLAAPQGFAPYQADETDAGQGQEPARGHDVRQRQRPQP